MTEETKPAAKPAAKRLKVTDKVKVKNVSKGIMNVSGGKIEPGKEGICTGAELRQFNKKLKQVK